MSDDRLTVYINWPPGGGTKIEWDTDDWMGIGGLPQIGDEIVLGPPHGDDSVFVKRRIYFLKGGDVTMVRIQVHPPGVMHD